MCMFKPQLNITIFMIIQLINMNIGLREYPMEVWVTTSPEFPPSPIVSDLNRCSRRGSRHSFVRRRRRGSSHTGVSSRVRTLPKNLIARLSRAGFQQQDEVPEALLSPVPCARCKRWRCKRKQQTEGEESGLLSRSTSFVNWQSEGEEEGALYRRAARAGDEPGRHS
jgi:hypothetical protein